MMLPPILACENLTLILNRGSLTRDSLALQSRVVSLERELEEMDYARR